MSGAVELTAAWWMEPTGTGRVRRMRGEVLNLSADDAARLVSIGAAKPVTPEPTAKPGPKADAESPRRGRKPSPRPTEPVDE